ncbi:N-acetylglucosamine-6-phosphate deacetylase [Pseudothermotoga sp. U03pept]|uniref:N-acetylglucosamine-6-phosphate deacetylase n=1 Tax=Pseudothermotoga sp. U03pept TaxID=3447012 RepID=UPI003F0ECD6D
MRVRFKKLFTPHETFNEMCLGIENGVVEKIEDSKTRCDLSFPILVPGFIDSHTHGAVGIDLMSATVDDLQKLSSFYAKHGVTTFLPTTVSDTFEKISRVAEVVEEFMKTQPPGARCEGLYIEGPYLSNEKRGAHKKELLKNPDLGELMTFIERFAKVVRIFAIAPELSNSLEAIRYLAGKKIIVSIAHTDSTYEQTIAAIDNGCSRATHLFNAMRSFSHREPGVVGAVLTDKRVFCEIICDMIHLHPAAVKLAISAKGPRRCVLVTDSIAATELEDGEYSLGELKVVVKDKIARTKEDQSLAGSTLTLDEAVRNVVFKLDVNLKDAITMATQSAARASGLKYGVIRTGRSADFVALDENLKVVATFVSGKMVYSI